MTPGKNSRHQYCSRFEDSTGVIQTLQYGVPRLLLEVGNDGIAPEQSSFTTRRITNSEVDGLRSRTHKGI